MRIMPGVRINLSKTGVSTSIGGRGATVNVSKRGVRGTVGLPGSGLSYSQRLDGGGRKKRSPIAAPATDGNPAARTGMSRGVKIVVWTIVIAILISILS